MIYALEDVRRVFLKDIKRTEKRRPFGFNFEFSMR